MPQGGASCTAHFRQQTAIDLSADIREVLVADPVTVKVIPRTRRRVYVIGAALGKTNVFFFDDDGRQIVALDVWVSEIVELQSSELGETFRRQQRDPVSRHFLNGLRLRD